jgi:hypothetical protein
MISLAKTDLPFRLCTNREPIKLLTIIKAHKSLASRLYGSNLSLGGVWPVTSGGENHPKHGNGLGNVQTQMGTALGLPRSMTEYERVVAPALLVTTA